MTDSPVVVNKKTDHSIFAIISLIIAVLDIPLFFCGIFFAMAFGMGGMVPLFIISMILPLLICLGGLTMGIIGLRSKYKWAAIIGIALPAIYIMLFCGYFLFSVIATPGSIIINTQ